MLVRSKKMYQKTRARGIGPTYCSLESFSYFTVSSDLKIGSVELVLYPRIIQLVIKNATNISKCNIDMIN